MTMIRKDMKILELSIDMVYNKMKWKKRIHNRNFNSLGEGG